jgi:cold shock CspA family protein
VTGTIVRIATGRGFGFIREPGGAERFFHASGVTGSTPFDALREGQAVDDGKTRDDRGRGARAVNVRPA